MRGSGARLAWLIAGWFFFAVGVVGVVLPGWGLVLAGSLVLVGMAVVLRLPHTPGDGPSTGPGPSA